MKSFFTSINRALMAFLDKRWGCLASLLVLTLSYFWFREGLHQASLTAIKYNYIVFPILYGPLLYGIYAILLESYEDYKNKSMPFWDLMKELGGAFGVLCVIVVIFGGVYFIYVYVAAPKGEFFSSLLITSKSPVGYHWAASFCYIIWILFWAGAFGVIGLDPDTEVKGISYGDPSHVRGMRLISWQEAENKAKAIIGENGPTVNWGGILYPEKIASQHFLVAGATGSGKTLTLRLLMQSVIPKITPGSGKRAIVYDAKQDSCSVIAPMISKGIKTYILNPFDERSVGWDMAKDITSPKISIQIASILIPKEKRSSNSFFSDTAREILKEVFNIFLKISPGKWTFRDVIFAIKNRDRLEKLLAKTSDGRDLLSSHFQEARAAANILSTLATSMGRYEFIAASWAKSKMISLDKFLEEEAILILGNDESARTALDTVNQIIFNRLSALILSKKEVNSAHTWIFLDEVREAGKLDGLSSLLTKGRSKGAAVVLGFQDIEGLRSAYGVMDANEIVGQCANKAILRLASPETSKWASNLFGHREVLERRRTTSENESNSHSTPDGLFEDGHKSKTSGVSRSTSESEHIATRSVVLPSELMNIPITGRENGLTGYYQVPIVGNYRLTVTPSYLDQTLWSISEKTANFIERPTEDQYLQPWENEDLQRLNIAEAPPTGQDGPLQDEIVEKRQSTMKMIEVDEDGDIVT